MGNINVALLVVSFVVVLLSRMSFLSGDTQAQQQGYREDNWVHDILHHKIKIWIDNQLDIPLETLCYSEDEKPGNQVIQPGQTYFSKFNTNGFLISGPPVYCEMRWGPSSLEFTAFDGWRDKFEAGRGVHYTVNGTGVFKNWDGEMSKFIVWD